jgi:jumonji domain-containing protein 7
LGGPLRAMAPMPPQAARLRPLLTNLWLGKGATVSPLHYDEYENLLCQVSGVKELLLFPPDDLPHLEYKARPRGVLDYEWPNGFARRPVDAAARATRVVFAGSVNMSHPSAAQRRALSRCRPLRCTLRPGETLLLPAYWHHEVYSRPAAAGDGEAEGGAAAPLNVAVNFWFRNETAPPASF